MKIMGPKRKCQNLSKDAKVVKKVSQMKEDTSFDKKGSILEKNKLGKNKVKNEDEKNISVSIKRENLSPELMEENQSNNLEEISSPVLNQLIQR